MSKRQRAPESDSQKPPPKKQKINKTKHTNELNKSLNAATVTLTNDSIKSQNKNKKSPKYVCCSLGQIKL